MKKKNVFKWWGVVLLLCMCSVHAEAQDLKSILSGVAKAVVGNKATTASSIIGTWTYSGPECQFESENLLAKAGGAETYKLKYGHRSHNQPVRMVGTNRCFVTSQNHGYAVDNTTLSEEWEPLFQNMNDDTNEGLKHKSKPFFSVQFHPEAASGPTDTEFLFDEFIKMID